MRALLLATALVSAAAANAQGLRPDQQAFRGLYKELVETNTTVSAGSCTIAAEKMATRLKSAGFADADIRLFPGPKDRPQDGGLVATLAGKDAKAKAILLLAHIDVVEARRADWERDPFTLIEEDGWFYGRGVTDDKAQAAIFTDTLIRLKQAGKSLKRTLKLALTCGEEGGPFNGAKWLAETHKDWIDAEFALNEGGIGAAGPDGRPINLSFQAGEKVSQTFIVEARNPGGHSSLPRPDNAIYQLAAGLTRLSTYEFPVQFNDTTRGYFAEMARITGGDQATAIRRLLANPADTEANRIVSQNIGWHAVLRTACVATRLDAGHATNALPQRAQATVNCRMFPGDSVETVRGQISAALADPGLTVTPQGTPGGPPPDPPALRPDILGPAVTLAAKYWPGVPVVPTLLAGATDGRFLIAAGIPTYGVPGTASMPDGNNVHGLNERMKVSELYTDRDYLFDLITTYAGK